MNTLNSNPKNNMFYAAAQNLLNSHQNSYSMLRKNMQLPYGVNLKDKVNTQNQNLSDRSLIQNNPRPKRLDIIMELKRYDKEKSLSNLRNSSFDSIKSSHAYNIKGHFQQIHESQDRIKEKDVQKNELKEYLLQQIEEKKRRQREEDELKRIEDQKAEERLKRQLEEMKARQRSIDEIRYTHQQQETISLSQTCCLEYISVIKIKFTKTSSANIIITITIKQQSITSKIKQHIT